MLHHSSIDTDGPVGRQADGRDPAVLHAGEGNSIIHGCEGNLAHIEPPPGDPIDVGTGGRQHQTRGHPHLTLALAREHDAVGGCFQRHVVGLAKGSGVGQVGIDGSDTHPRPLLPVAQCGEGGRGDEVRAILGRGHLEGTERHHPLMMPQMSPSRHVLCSRLQPRHGEETLMCSPATCSRCSKVTWYGCGEHIDEVMVHVPEQQRCTCR